jgi:xanthine phosphoribosyltransferase
VNKLVIKQREFNGLVARICREISNSNWRPDYIVGLTRGGLLPAVMISQYFDIPCETLKISLRDGSECESNCWMAEDAFGYNAAEVGGPLCKNILVVDDINDQGTTLNWLMNDWQSSCLPGDARWDHVWNQNVKFAVVVDNLSSKCTVGMDFVGMEVNKAENDVWIEFPYEEWWTK